MVKGNDELTSDTELKIKIPKTELVRVQDLKENPHNVKDHPAKQVKGLKELIKLEGFISPLVIDKNNLIWAGHGRIIAARELNMLEVPCVRLEHLTKKQFKAIMIMDNKINESAWNEENVGIILSEIPDFDFEEFHMNFDEFRIEGETTEDEIPEPPAIPKSKLGDVYQLGNHRIMCGDNNTQYNKLLDNKKIDQLVTDPPYGVDYGNKNKFLNSIDKGNRVQKEIHSDNIKNYKEFFEKFIEPIQFNEYNTIHICMSGKELVNLYLAMVSQKVTPSDFLVWVKNNHVLGRKDYNSKHEFVFYGWKGKHKFYGPHRTTVLEYNKPLVNDLHPTMKPVELISQLITDGSPSKGIVYDPFLGSGTTLIACEQTNRICYGMEIDPGYIDVIIQRWETFTGKKAKKFQIVL